MREPLPDAIAIPLVEERIEVAKRIVETGRVRVSTRVEEYEASVPDALTRERVEIERVPIGREIDAMPSERTEGDTRIIPVVEEVLVVVKRLRLVEEIRIRRVVEVERIDDRVTLRRTVADVERS